MTRPDIENIGPPLPPIVEIAVVETVVEVSEVVALVFPDVAPPMPELPPAPPLVWQTPAEHTSLAAQALLQPPQCWPLPCRSTHAPPHAVSPV